MQVGTEREIVCLYSIFINNFWTKAGGLIESQGRGVIATTKSKDMSR